MSLSDALLIFQLYSHLASFLWQLSNDLKKNARVSWNTLLKRTLGELPTARYKVDSQLAHQGLRTTFLNERVIERNLTLFFEIRYERVT